MAAARVSANFNKFGLENRLLFTGVTDITGTAAVPLVSLCSTCQREKV
jgi:hypothetical protein